MATRKVELEACLENCVRTGLGVVITHTNGMIYMYPSEMIISVKSGLMHRFGNDLDLKGSPQVKIKEFAPVEDLIMNQVYDVLMQKGSR